MGCHVPLWRYHQRIKLNSPYRRIIINIRVDHILKVYRSSLNKLTLALRPY